MTSGDSAPASVKSELQPSPKKVSGSSEVTRKPLQIRSPLAENKKPKWVPPGMVCLLIKGRGLENYHCQLFFLVANVIPYSSKPRFLVAAFICHLSFPYTEHPDCLLFFQCHK